MFIDSGRGWTVVESESGPSAGLQHARDLRGGGFLVVSCKVFQNGTTNDDVNAVVGNIREVPHVTLPRFQVRKAESPGAFLRCANEFGVDINTGDLTTRESRQNRQMRCWPTQVEYADSTIRKP